MQPDPELNACVPRPLACLLKAREIHEQAGMRTEFLREAADHGRRRGRIEAQIVSRHDESHWVQGGHLVPP
jgi:hypothetical protein